MRNIAPFITLLCLVVFFSVAAPSFASLGNLQNILQQVSVTAIIAVGLTFVILTAEIDLSVGAVANATAIVLTFFTLQPDYVNIANLPMPGPIAIVLALAACCALGLITAFGVTRIGIPSFIMTLAMMQIGAGLSAVLVRGQIAYSVPSLILTLGSKSIGGVPWIVIVAAIFLLVAHLVLTYTRFGRYVYMVGGNREAAEYSGVNVRLIVGAVMVISAMCSGVAGMIGVAYFGSAQQNEFDTFLLDAIAAVVVGGTSLFGGRGGIGNTIVGLFVLGVLNNGLDYVKIDSFLKILIRGLILLAALIINVYAERLRTARSGDRARLEAAWGPTRPSTDRSLPARSPEFRSFANGSAARRPTGASARSATAISISSSLSKGPTAGVVVEQALPYVRLVGQFWPLPPERRWFEYSALTEQARHAPRLTPKVFHFDRAQAMIVMEYLHPHVIMRKGLIRGIEYPRFADDIAEFLASTLFSTSVLAGTAAEHKARAELFAPNIALCKITEDLVFTDPYREAPLNRWTRPWLDAAKRAFERDSALKVAAQARKYQFMTSAQALIHGDLHTGSIMVTLEDTRVIDPEFAFIGPIGFDVGAVIGNLLLAFFAARGPRSRARRARRLPRLDSRSGGEGLVRVPPPLSRTLARRAVGRRLSCEPLRIR